MFRKLRILVLLYLLLLVAGGSWLARERTTDWDAPLWVVIYPIPGDRSPETLAFVDRLEVGDFAALGTFFRSEAKRHGLALERPFTFKLAPRLDEQPPAPPTGADRSVIDVMLYSLQLRYWAWRHDDHLPGIPADVQMFVTFHAPAEGGPGHDSLAIREGLIGVVNGYASRRQMAGNQVVIAHELLHTVGATDKYDPATNLPLYPAGYAEPAREPRYPQRHAELMGGRTPLAPDRAEMPASLKRVRIGAVTAIEIGWTR